MLLLGLKSKCGIESFLVFKLQSEEDEIMSRNCFRCGRRISNDSEICFDCNNEWQKYMKTHPLADYQNLSMVRWKEFLNDNPSRRGL